jgi:hypothetical protein
MKEEDSVWRITSGTVIAFLTHGNRHLNHLGAPGARLRADRAGAGPLPQVLRTDNGPEFLGEIFTQWAKPNGMAIHKVARSITLRWNGALDFFEEQSCQ